MQTIDRLPNTGGMISLLLVAVLLFLPMTACNTAGTLQNIISVATLAVDTVAALEPNIPGVALAAKYLTAVGQGVDCAITERQSTDSLPVQIAKITACVSAAILPALPPGTPAVIANVLEKVAQAVATYLSNLTAPATKAALAKATSAAPLAKLDGATLPALQTHLAALQAKVKALR